MQTIAENTYGTGAIFEEKDPTRAAWKEVGYALAPANWEAGYDIETVLKVTLIRNDQGQSGSCGGQSDEKVGEILNTLSGKPYTRLSAKFTYAQVYYPGGGTTDSALVILATTDGWGTEADTPSYQDAIVPPTEAFMEASGDITEVARANAIKKQALAPVYVNEDIDSIAQAIQAYGAVRIGIVGTDNGTWLSDMPSAPTAQTPAASLWYHFLCACKFRMYNGRKQIGVINSWGSSVGDNGVQWLDQDYFDTALPQSPYGKAVWVATTYVYNATPATELHYHFMSELDLGATGEDVIALQEALQIGGFFPASLQATGYFGAITQTALKSFQTHYGILAVGRVGPQTLAKLNSLYYTS